MKIWRRSKRPLVTSSESKLNTIIELVKDLPKADYNKLKDGMDLIYNGYQKIRSTRTTEEKEMDELTSIEKSLDEERK